MANFANYAQSFGGGFINTMIQAQQIRWQMERARRQDERYEQALRFNQEKWPTMRRLYEARTKYLEQGGRSAININLPGKYQFGADLRKAGLTPSAITETLEPIPSDYSREQAAEYTTAWDGASTLFPEKRFWEDRLFQKDYSMQETASALQDYLKDADYYNKTPEQKEAILGAFETRIKSGAEGFAPPHEIAYDRNAPEIQAVINKQPSAFGKSLGGENTTDTRVAFQNQYKIGQTIEKGGRRWKIVGFDEAGEPLVDEIK